MTVVPGAVETYAVGFGDCMQLSSKHTPKALRIYLELREYPILCDEIRKRMRETMVRLRNATSVFSMSWLRSPLPGLSLGCTRMMSYSYCCRLEDASSIGLGSTPLADGPSDRGPSAGSRGRKLPGGPM